jgi:polyphosphate kinase
VVDEGLLPPLADNVQSWLLRPDGTYVRSVPGPGEAPYSAQNDLLARLARATPPVA